MTKDISIAVIITTHNRPEKLQRAILSLVLQKRLPDEVIIVDDGSDSPYNQTLLRQFPTSVQVRHLELRPARGVSAARNEGVVLSQSTYICFLDDDDQFYPEKLQELEQAIIKNNAPEVVFHDAHIVFPNEGISYSSAKPSLTKLDHKILLSNIFGSASRVACHRQFFHACGGFDESIQACEDWDLWIRFIHHGARVAYINKPLITYECLTRQSSLSKGSSNNEKGRQAIYQKNASAYAALSESDRQLCFQNDEKDRFWRLIVNYQLGPALHSAWRLFWMSKRLSTFLLVALTLCGPRLVLRARGLKC